MSRKKTTHLTDHLTDHQKREAKAIRECLEYLEGAAADAGLNLCAHLIGLAAEATDGQVQPKKDEVEGLARGDARVAGNGSNGQAQHHKATVN